MMVLPGTFQSVTNFTGRSCTPCTAGSFCGARNLAAPTLCNAGSFAAAGAANCTRCATGATSGEGAAVCVVAAGWHIAAADLSVQATCPAGQFCPGGGALGAPSINGSGIVACEAGTFSASTGESSTAACVACAERQFSGAGAAACTWCPPGWTSGKGSASCPSQCEHPSAPASCPGVYTFAAGATAGCYFGSYATLTGGAWVPGASSCTDCVLGAVSTGWAAPGDVADAAACFNTTLVIQAIACTGTTANVTFRGGEQRAGVAPSNHGLGSDIFDAQLEVAASSLIGGLLSVARCSASATQDGVFTCAGLVPDEGNKCATDGTPPVGSLTVGAAAAFACAGAGAVAAVFTGGNYATVTQASAADLAFVSAFAAPATIAARNATFYAGVGGDTLRTQPGYCYLDTPASSNVTCYGYTPADGYACAGAAGAAPTPCIAGTYSNATQPASLGGCLACGPSTYSAAAGATSCAACPAGSSSETAAGNDALSSCRLAPGFYISGAPNAETPVACAANSFCPGSGRVGTISEVGTAASPLGITPCPAGSSLAASSANISNCTLLPGWFAAADAPYVPALCPANAYCAGGGNLGVAGGSLGCPSGSLLAAALNGTAAAVGNDDVSDCLFAPPLPPPPSPPPPSPPPALRPPPAPPVSFVSVVSISMSFAGYSVASFDAAAQEAFTRGLAAAISVPEALVAITSIGDAPGGARRLSQATGGGGVSVGLAIFATSDAMQSSLSGSLTAFASDPSALSAALVSAGLSNAVVLSMAPPTVTLASSPPPPPPVPGSGSVISAETLSDLLFANNSSTNSSALEAAVTSQLAGMSPEAASVAQAAMLTQLSSMNTSGSGEAAASLVLAVVSAAPGVVLSRESQNAALNVLLSVASGPINVMGGAAQSITAALSAVASSGMANNPAALAAVAGVLDNLASSQASGMVAALAALAPGAPPPEPAITSSPTIQTLVQIDPPGSNRLTTQNLTAPGSPSRFDPMPADLLAGAGAVVTSFFSLAFDPNGGANTTGLTRLAFSNPDGSPIVVEGATTPIVFTLPRVDVAGDGDEQAVCSFWDTAAGAYATHGCMGVPSPAPPNHTLAWVPGFTAANDSALALAWNISGPLLDGCRVAVLDCNADAPGVVYPDPRDPLRIPAVACPPRANGTNATQPALRVYYGTACALWRSGNAANCSWDAIKQAFVGGGCVAAAGPTQCMCRHLSASSRACLARCLRVLTRRFASPPK
jgi:hypothetical protein